MSVVEEKPVVLNEGEEEEEEDEEEELTWSSDSEIEEALDWLDSKDDGERIEGTITMLNPRRPNAHGGLHSRLNTSTLQPLSNRNQKFAHHIRASPLEVSNFELLWMNFRKSWWIFYDLYIEF